MFMYEMLTLKLPFDGQEQVKEYILEGGRPTLTLKVLGSTSSFSSLLSNTGMIVITTVF